MPCNLNTICFVDQYNEIPGKTNFVVNAVGIVSSRHQNINIFVHIIAFYPRDTIKDSDLEKFNTILNNLLSFLGSKVTFRKIRLIHFKKSLCH
jgi:hypothetical protein